MSQRRHELGLSLPLAQAHAAATGVKTVVHLPITAKTVYIDGRPAPAIFRKLVWNDQVFIDRSPSPTGNRGPYFHVPHLDGETVHRVYPRLYLSDVFWVRERWAITASGGLEYEAPGQDPTMGTWRAAYLLSRRDARTILEIDEVRAQRADTVSELESRAAGFPCDLHPEGLDGEPCGCVVSGARFREAWQEEHGRESAAAWCWSYRVKRETRG